MNFSNRDVTNFLNNNEDGDANAPLEDKFNSNPITFVPST